MLPVSKVFPYRHGGVDNHRPFPEKLLPDKRSLVHGHVFQKKAPRQKSVVHEENVCRITEVVELFEKRNRVTIGTKPEGKNRDLPIAFGRDLPGDLLKGLDPEAPPPSVARIGELGKDRLTDFPAKPLGGVVQEDVEP